jgi:hypothetical protein
LAAATDFFDDGMATLLYVSCFLGVLNAAGMTFTTIQRGQHSGIEEAREVVVRSASDWTTLWKQHAPEQAVPAIDFARSTVVGVFLGSRSTAGYTVEITAIEQKERELIVVYRERQPDPQAMVAQVITFPYHLVRIDRHDGSVRFRRAPAAQDRPGG